MNLIKSIGVFLWAVVRQTAAYMTGGLVAAGETAYEHYTGKNIPMDAFSWGIAAFFITACFLIWKEQHELAINLLNQINDKAMQRAIREQLGKFLKEGQEIQEQCSNHQELPAPTDRADKWGNDVQNFLRINLDESYNARLISEANLLPVSVSIQSMNHRNLWLRMRVWLSNLKEILAELSSN